jgi:hypothetical protein
VGLRSTDRMQIVSGLHAGQRVVLATVTAAVPTSSNQLGGRFGSGTGQLRNLTGGSGRFGPRP